MTNPTPEKSRLDEILVKRGLVRSRSEGQTLIRDGAVFVEGVCIRKASQRISENNNIEVSASEPRFASRGGYKLAHALEAFRLRVDDQVALDIGASTGGFTDVLLKQGARKVCALDVGHGQLVDSLRHDPRVHVMEGVNARYLTADQLPEIPGIFVCDVSFISLRLILPPLLEMAGNGSVLVALIKPQFELSPQEIGKNGIVRDEDAHRRAINSVRQLVETSPGWRILDVVESPIKGGDGNTEFLLGARRGDAL